MIKNTFLFIVIWISFIPVLNAKIYIRDYTYDANELDSEETSRVIALDQIKYILLSEIGTHIRHTINIKKGDSGDNYANEDIEAITAGLTKVKILEEKWNKPTFYLKAEIEADENQVLNALEEFKRSKSVESKQQLEALKESQKNLKASREEVSRLKQQLNSTTGSIEKEKLVKKYTLQVDQLSLYATFIKAYGYYQQGRYSDAAYWYQKSAEKGLADAQHNLGDLYYQGKGVVKDDKQAEQWFRKAAEQGLGKSQSFIGYMYAHGIALEKDHEQGVFWFRKAAEQGLANAQYNLGDSYYQGNGVKQSFNEAFKWWKKAADQGYAISQFTLAILYQNGQGVEKDQSMAKQYFEISCSNGYEDACKFK
jgi:TPR repeat protein